MNMDMFAARRHGCRPMVPGALWLIALFVALSLAAPSTLRASEPLPGIGDLFARENIRIALELRAELDPVVRQQPPIEGQGPNRGVRQVRLDANSGYILVDLHVDQLQQGYGYISGDLEDQLTELVVRASDLVAHRIAIDGVDFLFDGKDIYHYYPDERPGHHDARAGWIPFAATDVLVSAGHGAYYHHGFNDWRLQRDPVNGIVEDDLTPVYAAELSALLAARSGSQVHRPRSTGTDEHEPSGYAWWRMGARYNLANVLPDEPGIWNSLPDATTNLRERDEDIRSRPLLANHLGVDVALHLHTNAAGPAATGTRVFFQTGRAGSQALGDSILCYMQEVIQAQEGYETFNVPARAVGANHGENRLAQMDSVIVEVAFHTNPQDAAALLDPAFRSAAMKGVEKGYRLLRQGESCIHLDITGIPHASGPWGGSAEVEVSFEGFPQFPLDLVVDLIDCPPGYVCTPGQLRFEDEVPSPITYAIGCNSDPDSPPASAQWRTTLIDADGVSTEQLHAITCGSSPIGPGEPATDGPPRAGSIRVRE